MAEKNNKENPKVSVIIPCYNSAKTIESCLHSLLQQKTNFEYEVIVVDSSTDETPVIINEKFPAVKLIHLEQQTYPGAGRNIGVKQAQGNIIAFIDSDCLAAEDWMEKAVGTINEEYCFAGGGVMNGNPHSSISKVDFWLTFNEFTSSTPERKVIFMPTCNFVCTKKAFLDLGGFDPRLLAGEDTLFCLKASQQYPLLFNPKMIVSHINRTKFKPFLKHHYSFGQHSAYLRQNFELSGSRLSKYALLSFLAPAVKYIRITLRMMRWNHQDILSYFLLTPLVLAGFSVWGIGFVKTSFTKRLA